MTKTYAIQVLDTSGDVILSTRGRAGALAKAIAELDDYRAACTAGSGRLFTHAAAHGQVRRDALMVDGVNVKLSMLYNFDAAAMIAGFDKRGVAADREWYLALEEDMAKKRAEA